MITKHDVTPPRPDMPSTREDSHAFSLDSLRALEAAQTSAVAQAADSSGVIDLDALRFAGPMGAADDLTTSRLVTNPEPMLPPPSSAPRWAVATLGLLGGAVVALTTMVAVGMPHGTTATQDPAPRPTMAAAAVFEHDADARLAHGLQIDGAVIPHVSQPAPAPMQAAEPEPKPEPAPKARSKSKRAKKRAVTAKPKPTTPAAPAPKAEPKPQAKGQDELSVQCIVDPASCGRGAAKPKAKPKTPAVSLPAKLTSSQIRKALSGPKSEANKQCRDMHAAPAGTTVKVKLSIAGTGKVRSAAPQAPHANSLGRCVAAALGTATFDPFGSPAMGVVYSVRL